MRKAALLATLVLATAGFVHLQTSAAEPRPPAIMPSGALLCLETPDFARLLGEWSTSKVKFDWLESANYEVFSRSNLFTKLQQVYGEYGNAAGFVPGLKSLNGIAGTESALALYGIRDVEFLYVTRIAETDLVKSELWAVRDKFEQRQAGGVSFYWRTDPASQRTVAFAFTKGYLLLATRDDLVGRALELLAGNGERSVASDGWYRDAVAAASRPGDLRLVMNLESLVKNVYFRSYWVQRNAALVRRYRAGISDVKRTEDAITESRVLLRSPDDVASALATDDAVSRLTTLAPPEAGFYKAWRLAEAQDAAALIVQNLVEAQPSPSRDDRYAPAAASPDRIAGSESDLETDIQEAALPADAGIIDCMAAVRPLADNAAGHAILLVESSEDASGPFVHMPTVMVLEGSRDWDRDSIRRSLSTAAGKLWTSSQLGAGWVSNGSEQNPVERLDGLGTLFFTNRGRLLLVANNLSLLHAVLGRTGITGPSAGLTYAAGFRHQRERSRYERIMGALDFSAPAGGDASGKVDRPGPPPFFSGNIASLSRVLSRVVEIHMTEQDRGTSTFQTVSYQLRK